MITLREQLLTVADAYLAAGKISRTRLSTIIFNGGLALDRIAAGGDLNTGTFEKAMQWFSTNWPEGVSWPENIDRPPHKNEAA